MSVQLENFTLALREYAGNESLPIAKNWMEAFGQLFLQEKREIVGRV